MDGSIARPLLHPVGSVFRPLRLPFSRTCVIRGRILVATSMLCFGTAPILATQRIPLLDDGVKRSGLLFLFACFLGVALLFRGFQQAISRIVITATEFSLEPDWCGFRLHWSQIRKWTLKEHPEKRTTDLLLWLRSDDQPRRISSSWLDQVAFQRIIAELESHHDAAPQSTVS